MPAKKKSLQNLMNVFMCHVSSKELQIKSFTCILFLAKDEKALKEAVDKYGPTAISINAGDDFQHYDHGVFYG